MEVLTLTIGLYLALIYKGQWSTAETSNQINTNNFKASQRPWIGPIVKPGESPLKMGDVGYPSTWVINFKNFGNSPALQVRCTLD